MNDGTMRILFLEDDPEFIQLIKDILDNYVNLPHILMHAGTLKQAFALLHAHEFDVGLIDLHLPDSAGLETLIRLRTRAPQLPMVVLTGQKDEEYARRALDAGAQDFLLKEEVLPRLLIRVIKYAIERKQAEKALKESEQRQKVILNSAQAGIIVVEPRSHTVVEANPAALKMFGRTKNEVVGQICYELICPVEKGKCPITDLKLTIDRSEHELVKADGGRMPILKTANPIMLGGKDHILETFLDITEIKEAREFLEKSRERLEKEVRNRTRELEAAKMQWEATFHAVPDVIAIIDQDYRIIRANQALAVRFACQPQDLIGQSFYELLYGDSNAPPLYCPHTVMWEKGTSQAAEITIPRLETSFLISSSPLFDSTGKISAGVVVARDITDLKKAERRLKEQLDFVQLMVETVPNPIFIKNRQGVYTGCNKAFCEFLGMELEEIVGKTAYEVAPKDLADIYHAHDLQLLEKQGVQNYEASVRGARGEIRDVIYYKAPYFDSQGQPAGLVGVIVDITERKQMEEQMRRSQKLEAIGQLAAGVAHEINTPTQFIQTNQEFLDESFKSLLDLLSKSFSLIEEVKAKATDQSLAERAGEIISEVDIDLLREDVEDALSGTMEGVERISKIVESMRYFAHPGTEKKAPIDINKALEQAITVSRNEWKYYADMETDFDPSLPTLMGYSTLLNQALLNVIINAAQAISEKLGQSPEEKGLISISTRHDKDWVEIRISDTGGGIPEDVLSKIFDPFFTTKTLGKGTGQGLALVQNNIEGKHGGKVDVETGQGKGTTFIIRLPATES